MTACETFPTRRLTWAQSRHGSFQQHLDPAFGPGWPHPCPLALERLLSLGFLISKAGVRGHDSQPAEGRTGVDREDMEPRTTGPHGGHRVRHCPWGTEGSGLRLKDPQDVPVTLPTLKGLLPQGEMYSLNADPSQPGALRSPWRGPEEPQDSGSPKGVLGPAASASSGIWSAVQISGHPRPPLQVWGL